MKPSTKAFWKKWLGRIAWFAAVIVLFVALMELFYRYQWIDTYKKELNALNLPPIPPNPKKKVLVMGDSFTAATNTWVNLLRKQHPDLQFVNSSVPGTTIYQANLMLQGRLEAFKPDLMVYQVYVGNDLFDLRYPTNWSTIGFGRNLYWTLANHVRSLAFANYALGQLKRASHMPDYQQGKDMEGEFDPQKYSERERIYLQAEPGLIGNQALLQGGRAADMADYLELLEEFLATASAASVPVIVLVVPHCAQVHPRYALRLQQVGASGMEDAYLQMEKFPFWEKISALGSEKVHFVNLLPEFQVAEQQGQAIYYLHDAHLSDAGQQVLTDVVDSALQAYRLINSRLPE